MKILEFNEDDFRELELEESEMVEYKIDNLKLKALTEYLGYEIVTDGNKVFAVNGNDIIEIGDLKKDN